MKNFHINQLTELLCKYLKGRYIHENQIKEIAERIYLEMIEPNNK
jgi:hypothetical protein